MKLALVAALPVLLAACGDDMNMASDTFPSLPDQALVIANGGSEEVTVVDPATLTVIGSVSVMEGMHPHHISIAPGKTHALITATSADLSLGHGSGGHGTAAASTMVYLLDAGTRTLRDVLTVSATAHNATFTPDGTSIAFGMMEHGMIAIHDAATFEETYTASGFEMPLEVTSTSGGALLVAESGAARVAVFDLASRTTTNTFDVGAMPVAAWSSGGPDYFVSVEEGMVVRHLVEGGADVTVDDHTIDPGGMPGQAFLTPDGRELWVAVEDRGVIATFDAQTHQPIDEITAGTKPHGIAFDPDGTRAFVTDEEGGALLVIDTETRAVTSILELGGKPNGIVWF